MVKLNINTKKNSSISLCIIDKSLELIQSSNDLTSDHISEQLNRLNLYSYYESHDYIQNGDIMFRGYGFWERPLPLIELNVKFLKMKMNLIFKYFENFRIKV